MLMSEYQAADLQVVVGFILHVDVGRLAAGAVVHELLFRGHQGNGVLGQGIERALDFKEQLLMGHPPHPHPRRMQGRFNSRHQTVELRQEVLVLPPRPLNALAGRETPLGPAI